MTRATFEKMWDHLRLLHGITLRCVEAIPEDQVHAHPIASMRTPKELVTHMYALMRGVARGLATGAVPDYRHDGAEVKTRAELIAFCRECWDDSARAVAVVTEEHLNAIVQTPWGRPLPGVAVMGALNDEYLHHRGQLYAFLRAMGQDVPSIWDFAGNAPEYRPRQTTNA